MNEGKECQSRPDKIPERREPKRAGVREKNLNYAAQLDCRVHGCTRQERVFDWLSGRLRGSSGAI